VQHDQALAVVCAIALLLVFAVSTRAMLQTGERKIPTEARERAHVWPLRLGVAVLAACGVGTVLVSDWFVQALDPAIDRLGISQEHAGTSGRRDMEARCRCDIAVRQDREHRPDRPRHARGGQPANSFGPLPLLAAVIPSYGTAIGRVADASAGAGSGIFAGFGALVGAGVCTGAPGSTAGFGIVSGMSTGCAPG
jgi:hypothetical protein